MLMTRISAAYRLWSRRLQNVRKNRTDRSGARRAVLMVMSRRFYAAVVCNFVFYSFCFSTRHNITCITFLPPLHSIRSRSTFVNNNGRDRSVIYYNYVVRSTRRRTRMAVSDMRLSVQHNGPAGAFSQRPRPGHAANVRSAAEAVFVWAIFLNETELQQNRSVRHELSVFISINI